MEALKKFVLAVGKIGIGIAVAVLIGVAVVLAYQQLTERATKRADAPLATRKDWPDLKVESLGNPTFRLATMWKDSEVFYQFAIDGYPPALEAARSSAAKPSFLLVFKNAQGFKILEIPGTIQSIMKQARHTVGLEMAHA